MPGMKQCPFCAEEILTEAIKCKHCGEMLTTPPQPENQPIPKPKSGSGLRTILIALGVMAALFIVAVIIVIVAAIAIPQMVNATDRGRQRRTMADMRNIAVANGTMRVDTGQYAVTLRDLQVNGYLQVLPANDGWDNAFNYVVGPDTYTLVSLGSDGREGPPPPVPWVNDPYVPDIILTDGGFTQAPTGR